MEICLVRMIAGMFLSLVGVKWCPIGSLL